MGVYHCFPYLTDPKTSAASLHQLSVEVPSTPPPKVAPKPPTKPLKHSTADQSQPKKGNSSGSTSSAGLVKKPKTTIQQDRNRLQANKEEKSELRGMFMKMKQSRAQMMAEEEASRLKMDGTEEEEETGKGDFSTLV